MNSTTSPPNSRARVVIAVLAAAAVAASPAVVQAQTDESFGQHVSMCAQTSLGKRANPPAITCSHAGQGHEFATFGEMVQYMREHHGGH